MDNSPNELVLALCGSKVARGVRTAREAQERYEGKSRRRFLVRLCRSSRSSFAGWLEQAGRSGCRDRDACTSPV